MRRILLANLVAAILTLQACQSASDNYHGHPCTFRGGEAGLCRGGVQVGA